MLYLSAFSATILDVYTNAPYAYKLFLYPILMWSQISRDPKYELVQSRMIQNNSISVHELAYQIRHDFESDLPSDPIVKNYSYNPANMQEKLFYGYIALWNHLDALLYVHVHNKMRHLLLYITFNRQTHQMISTLTLHFWQNESEKDIIHEASTISIYANFT